jgi:deoxyribodipyrimidine photo-lyase
MRFPMAFCRPRPSIVWFRRDLRLSDQPALSAAARRGGPVVPLFVWSPAEEGAWPPGGAARWWLHHALAALDAALRRRGSRLVLRAGPGLDAIRAAALATGAGAVFWNATVEPDDAARDDAVRDALLADGLEVDVFEPDLLFDLRNLRAKSGRPFQVFTPFYRACLAGPPPADPLPPPARLPAPPRWPRGVPLGALGLLPAIDWSAGIRSAWSPGERGARDLLRRFLTGPIAAYAADRDPPARDGTSRLSPHLHWGEISAREIWHAAAARRFRGRAGASAAAYRRQLGWASFARYLLIHFPRTADRPLRPTFRRFPWARDARALRAWQKGRTGYPIVDAGMRQLWRTGWMHNRVRMIAASFLVKHLLLPWLDGARWFWDTLVDADLPNNTLGWQWAAGCGADAAPYFRIFNPVAQGERFDPEGAYVRRWVPELARVPADWIHKPWEAPAEVLAASGVVLGATYPRPVVDHAAARRRALAAFASLRETRRLKGTADSRRGMPLFDS